MLAAWSPIWHVAMTTLEDNLFLFSFEHRVDQSKVIREGPWRFNQFMLVMKEVYKDTPMSRSILTSIPFWIQIHNVPVLRRTERTARSLGGLLGTVLDVDIKQGRE